MKLRAMSAAILLAALAGAHTARADDFFFTFSSSGTPDGTLAAGAVLGEVFGLQNNATSAATSVVVLGTTADAPTPIVYSPASSVIFLNSFQESAGRVTAASFDALDFASFTDLQLNGEQNADSFSSMTSASPNIGSYAGFSGIALTAASPISAAPEPSAWLLMLTGVGLLGGLMRLAALRSGRSRALSGASS